MGVAFAEHFVNFASSQGLPVGSVTKIQSNPGQSKHLETGRITLLGLALDFVNLRSEEYAEDSRIPSEIVSFRSTRADNALALIFILDIWYTTSRRLAKRHYNERSVLQYSFTCCRGFHGEGNIIICTTPRSSY